MTDATVTFLFLHGRVFALGVYERVMNGVVIGLGAVAAVCVLVTTVTVVAVWIINTALATNPYIRTHAPTGSGTLGLAKYGPTCSAVDVSGSTRVSTAPTEAPDVTFEARWARATASAPTRAEPLVSERPLERANKVLSQPPHPLDVPHDQAKPEIAHTPI